MDVGTNLDQQGFARPNQPLTSRERREMKWSTDDSPARRASILADILADMRLSPEPREHTVNNLCSLQRLRQTDPPRAELLVIGDRNHPPTRVFNRCGQARAFDRFSGNFFRFHAAVVTAMQTITGGDAQRMRTPMSLRRLAGSFDRRRCMQMRTMPIMGVCQEGRAAKCPENQDGDQHHREHATRNPRPHNTVESRAAGG